MANENDKKIKTLLNAINKKKKDLGTKPKPQWKTNGVINDVNINTVNSIEKCLLMTMPLLQEKTCVKEACEFLGLTNDYGDREAWITDALDDLKLRTIMVVWESEKKKLTKMESQLKNLRSADAKTEDALEDISKTLE